MTLPPERAAELAKSPKAHKWKMIKAKVSRFFLLILCSDGNTIFDHLGSQTQAF